MKSLTFASYLIFLSAGLCTHVSAAQNETPVSTNATVSASADERADKKTVHRASRGPARPRLFWMRRASR